MSLVKELTAQELQVRLSALMAELQIEDGMVNRKYALSRIPRNCSCCNELRFKGAWAYVSENCGLSED